MKKNIIGFLVLFTGLIGIFWLTGTKQKENSPAPITPSGKGNLSADVSAYDFGIVSMAKGNVMYQFKIKNTGEDPVTISKMYTSCMCTTAKLITDNGEWGPFGMPGHGIISNINAALPPQKEATIEAIFDPNAHGPAGVGRIERIITVEQNGASPLELHFSANVTP